MKTLSVRAPWSELIVRGIKQVENRDWRSVPRQPAQWLAIHASQKEDYGCKPILEEFEIEEYTNGAIVGAAYWSASHNWKSLSKAMKENGFTEPSSTVFLLFTDAIKIEPFPCKGKLGFWPTPEEAEKRILREIKRCCTL